MLEAGKCIGRATSTRPPPPLPEMHELDGLGRHAIDVLLIIPAIIAMARGVKLRVIAEGIETAGQLGFLQLHGCDEYQGFYASVGVKRPRPYTPASIRPRVSSNRRMRASTWPWSDASGSSSTRWSFR
ncbi:MAG: EAL domain-containing protein [Telluria sp.]